MEAGVRAIAVFTAASEAFAQANIRMSVDDSVATFANVVKRAKADGMWVRAVAVDRVRLPVPRRRPVRDVVRVCERLLDARRRRVERR